MDDRTRDTVEVGAILGATSAAWGIDAWLRAAAPPRRRLWGAVTWAVGLTLGLTPTAVSLHLPGVWIVAPFMGAFCWGAIEVRTIWNNALYQSYADAAKRQKLWKYRPKNFDS